MLFVYYKKKIMTKLEKKKNNSYLPTYPIFFEHVNSSAGPRRIFIPLTQYGRPKNEPKFLKISPILFNFNHFNNCPFSLQNYFMTLYSCLVSKISQTITFVGLSVSRCAIQYILLVKSRSLYIYQYA